MSIIRGNRLFFALGGGGDDDMKKSVYDPTGEVEDEGGIANYVDNHAPQQEQSNWEQNYSSYPSYIQNRPMYDSSTLSNGIQSTVTASSSSYTDIYILSGGRHYFGYTFTQMSSQYFGGTGGYRVTLDGDVYTYSSYTGTTVQIGSSSTTNCNCLSYSVTDQIFIFQDTSYKIWVCFPSADNKSHTITLHWDRDGSLVKIPQKYLDLDSREKVTNKTTSLTSLSTDYQYPSAKAVYDFVSNFPIPPSVTLRTTTIGTTWEGTEPYTQVITIPGATVTEHSKIDLQPDFAVMEQLSLDGVSALWIENNNGVLTANAIGGYNTVALTIQCTITEVG